MKHQMKQQMKHYVNSMLCVVTIFLFNAVAIANPDLETGSSTEKRYGANIGAENWLHFVVYAPNASGVKLLLYDAPQATTPSAVIPMQRNGEDWKTKIKGFRARPGLHYMFQADGPSEVSQDDQFGLMHNPHFVLNDPYAYKTQNVNFSAFFNATPYTDISSSIYAGGGKSIVHDHLGELVPGHVDIAKQDLIIYELHVQDYTARIQTLAPQLRGTYLGLAQSGLRTSGGLAAGIDHLVELGVTAVELMPVMEYDEQTGNEAGRFNHWGYMTTNFFAPEARYASVSGDQVIELKQLIKAFHERGIAVFLDVVYNHTAEQGPWVDNHRLANKCFNFMCLASTEVYRGTGDERFFSNNTGTGNDVSFHGGDDRFTKRMVNDSLALWYETYGIDGFRFDLARILADGSNSAADWIDNDTRFSNAHLHAEPWDMGGQWWDFMDNFGWNHNNNRWAKWLGRYRDKSRRFSQSSLRDRRAFKQLIEGYGSVSDSFGSAASTKPWRSINLLAVHDGYTLRDCTSHSDSDASHNCWDSGGSENLRREREKMLLGVLLTSQGVPVILQGDEFGRTKGGVHNSYNFESSNGDTSVNHVNWIDWDLKDGSNANSPGGPVYGRELFNWTRDMIALRKQWSHFRREEFPTYIGGITNDAPGPLNDNRFTYNWEGLEEGHPSQLAVVWWGKAGEPDLMVVYNEHWESFTVNNLRDWSRGDWKVLARSWYGDEADFCDLKSWESNCPDAGDAIDIKGRSMAILVSDND